jgi:hypothetical protein
MERKMNSTRRVSYFLKLYIVRYKEKRFFRVNTGGKKKIVSPKGFIPLSLRLALRKVDLKVMFPIPH